MSGVTVSGPGVDRKAGSAALGLSAATTCANVATRAGEESSFYVRDGTGQLVGRADSDGHGGVLVYSYGPDRAPDGPRIAPRGPSGGRPSRPRAGEETFKANAQTTRVASEPPPTGSRPRPKEDQVATATNEKKTRTPAQKVDAGDDLLASLMAAVQEQVEDVKAVSNKSQTMTRLVHGGTNKAFAYISPPRPSGLAVKIPKHLLAVEGDLPKGHGFSKTKWGLTRTVKRLSETPKVAQALAVAAGAVEKEKETA